MSWPPNLPGTGFHITGQTTNIVWGTAGAEVGGLSNYIVKSYRATERVDQAIIENGDGLTAVQILLLDGHNVEFTVVDNTAVTPPISGQTVNLVVPQLGVNGASNNSVIPMLVVETAEALARKQDGERIVTAKSYVLFTPA